MGLKYSRPSNNIIDVVNNFNNTIYKNHDKYYIITGKCILSIKLLDDNLFVYKTDCNSTTLSLVLKINESKNLLKYVQVSKDFKIITLPEQDLLGFYNLTNFPLNCNKS